MRVTQVSAFLENRPGRLLHLLSVLAEAKVNVLAHDIVDASDFGIVHLIVDDPKKAVQAINQAGLTCSTTTVLAVNLPNEPGAFVEHVLRPLAASGVNIQYSYAFGSLASTTSQVESVRPQVVLKVDDMDRAEKALADEDQFAKGKRL
ncbi:MAG: amino acid-binding protein [Anaerolineae bacterium]